MFLFCMLVTVPLNLQALTVYDKPVSVDSRIKTFVYSENEVFTIVLNYGYHSYIEFSKGESAKFIAMGNTANWKVNTVNNKLFIMPLEKEGRTNMFVESNKGRSYIFDIICKPDIDVASGNAVNKDVNKLNIDYSAQRDLAYVVRFYYPKTAEEFDLNDIKLPDISPPSNAEDEVVCVDDLIKVNDTKYNYRYTADDSSVDIVPVELFDDGRVTYFKFPNNNKIIPKIFSKDKHNHESPIKMLSLNGYIIINGIYKNLSIRYKDKYVEIINKSL